MQEKRMFQNFILMMILIASCVVEIGMVPLETAACSCIADLSDHSSVIRVCASLKAVDIWSENLIEKEQDQNLIEESITIPMKEQTGRRACLLWILSKGAVLPGFFKKTWSVIGYCGGMRGHREDYNIYYIHQSEGYNSVSFS